MAGPLGLRASGLLDVFFGLLLGIPSDLSVGVTMGPFPDPGWIDGLAMLWVVPNANSLTRDLDHTRRTPVVFPLL